MGSPARLKRTEVVVYSYATSSASNTKKPRSFFATIEAENRFPSHHVHRSKAMQVNCYSPTLHCLLILSKPF